MKEEILVSNSHDASLEQRRVKSRANGHPNHFKRKDLAADLLDKYAGKDAAALAQENKLVTIAGRVMRHRSSFLDLQDMSGRIQVYLDKKSLAPELWEKTKSLDLGDIIGVEGVLFKTKTNQLSIFVKKLTLLCKSLRPLPDKFHGLSDSDKEQRYRKRYLDLIVDEETRKTFKIRSQLIQGIRQFLNQKGYTEVETPMMHLLPGGALARPFTTHHNALNMELFLRVAPELHLKRLVVGGMEKVYEINRNFRNEGLSTRHNPEFTMLEFYQAYADYHDLMDLTEVMLRKLAEDILGSALLTYQDKTYDFAKPFRRMSVLNAILEFNPHYTMSELTDLSSIKKLAEAIKINPEIIASDALGKIQFALFEETVEQNLLEPTFITEYPIAVSPLARRNDTQPEIADRFELYIAGREIANGFSELNDPEDQAARFQEQSLAKAQGDHEAMAYDEDYITALEYGLPPTAGEGIGIDRLAMLFTDSLSIRDVILFPLMRPER